MREDLLYHDTRPVLMQNSVQDYEHNVPLLKRRKPVALESLGQEGHCVV